MRNKLGPKQFRCAHCWSVFTMGNDAEDADEKYRRDFGKNRPQDATIVCIDCYKKAMPRLISMN